jgi:hypothetical protein
MAVHRTTNMYAGALSPFSADSTGMTERDRAPARGRRLKTVEQMQLVNALCRFVELSKQTR